MPEAFVQLPLDEQANILQTCAGKLGRRPEHLEKDVWICWVLQALFTMPGRLPMAFKGGTSLSKVFNAIQRFSEDCDVTISYLGFNNDFHPFLDNISKTALKKFTEKLRDQLRDYIFSVIEP